MSDAEFMKQRQDAVERMLEQSRQSTLPTPPFVKMGGETPPGTPEKPANPAEDAVAKSLPFSDGILREPDGILLAGLLLLLWNDRADRRLMLALLYILL